MDSADIENRFAFHAASTAEKRGEHTSIRNSCLALADFINRQVPECREKSLAMTHLEETMMWCNAAIARHQDEVVPQS